MLQPKAPPPPPAPMNPWAGRAVAQTESLIPNSIWPDRLLHVRTMTSYAREGHNIYNCVEAPEYNVLSYTWGYYQDPTSTEAPLIVHGVKWPIPRIRKDHFTPATFQKAIQRAAQGFRRSCEWLWVDIACIHQQHKAETREAALLRGQEIGRQVEIFQRAQEAFAWLSSLRKVDLPSTLRTVEDILANINQHVSGFQNIQTANQFLQNLDQDSQLLEELMDVVLKHPWFRSLWTLQEMVLRPDAWILFDDGFLFLGPSEKDQTPPWNFSRIKNDMFALQSILHDGRMFDLIKSAEVLTIGSKDGVRPRKSNEYLTVIKERLERLLDLQEERGLAAMNIEFPHTAYSIAQRRRVTSPKDRIYGIVQTYGISCNPFPPGEDDQSQLHALEDEFGTKLVARSPILSQTFIHRSADQKPRRSWLITQKCKVDDWFWTSFTTEWQVQNGFKTMRVIEPHENSMNRIYLKLQSMSWYLTPFVKSCTLSTLRSPLFRPRMPGSPQYYRGLMLDHHVSKFVFGRVVDYFDDLESMSQAVEALEQHYHQNRGFAGSRDPGYDSSCLRIALLGSSYRVNLPVVDYVGLVLAPMPLFNNVSLRVDQDEGACAGSKDPEHPEVMVWERVGLMRWTEIYHSNDEAPHQDLPPHQDIEYLVA